MELTPMMKQYLQIHKQAPDAILFFRLGDFYEMFFDDAIVASKVLSLVLTSRSCGLEDRAPMCGVPYHAANAYIAKLIKAGHKVAICEQVEDPSLAKGIVKREIVKIISPGTITDEALLNEKENNYLLCVFDNSYSLCISYIDISTAEFKTCLISGKDKYINVANEIEKICPKEIICNDNFIISCREHNVLSKSYVLQEVNSSYFDYESCMTSLKSVFGIQNLNKFGILNSSGVHYVKCVGAILKYLENNNRQVLKYIKKIDKYSQEDYMILDMFTRKNLELVLNMSSSEKYGSLLWLLDNCKTAMGSRKLKSWIENPLINSEKVLLRQKAVTEIRSDIILMDDLIDMLSSIYDLKRIATKICNDNCTPKDLLMLKDSAQGLKNIKTALINTKAQKLKNLYDEIDDIEDIKQLIKDSINPCASAVIKDGDVINQGYCEEIDNLRNISRDSQSILNRMEEAEREKTKIKTLKIKYNKVFGYYIDITNSYADLVPDNYIRKQTLANSERYYTQELKALESDILSCEQKLLKKEKEVFESVRKQIYDCVEKILKTADAVAKLDVLVSFAYTAYKNSYCKPDIVCDGSIELISSRHPIIEQIDKNNEFIPNSCSMDISSRRMQIITGPNMAGKSTYIRQIALIVLMAQIGSYVPAKSAKVSVVDRIFTRVGASDDLLTGRSTFMVEMSEVAGIIKNATKESLIILDEVGRGTSTYDGMSIAWAVCEYIANSGIIGAKTLFATHYHELTKLDQHEGIINLCIRAVEKENGVIFLRKIEEGQADKSYGIEVARLAGIPQEIILRASEILYQLEKKQDGTEHIIKTENTAECYAYRQNKPSITDAEAKTLDVIRELSIEHITPIEALNILYEIKKNLKD